MPSTPIRWGILSTARIGRRRVIPAIQQSRNGIVTAVASRSLEHARRFADALGIPKAYGSYEELLADPDVDALYNPLPNAMHAEWALKAAEAGKPMLCEKPLAANADEAQRMVDAYQQRGLLFAEAFMYRFHPQTQRVKAMVDAGVIGSLHTVQASFNFSISDEANIRLNKDLAGGSLMDVGCYAVNVIRLMTGEEPVDVQAFAQMGAHSGVDERLTGLLRFESGAMAHFDSSLRSQHRHAYELRGDKGRIQVEEGFVMPADRDTIIRVWENIGPARDVQSEIVIPASNSYTLMAEDFADALIQGRAPKYPPQDAVANMRVIDRLLAAVRPQ